jgi:hypothetical protein
MEGLPARQPFFFISHRRVLSVAASRRVRRNVRLFPPRQLRELQAHTDGATTMHINATVRVLILFLVCLFAGQAAAVGIGFMLDSYSQSIALATFIILYYGMYWAAWRVALLIGDRTPVDETGSAGRGGSPARIAMWLLAPALLTLDFAD